MSRAEPQSRKSFSLRFWLRMIGGELQRAVVCTKLHPNASLSPPLFGPKKSGKWPEEEEMDKCVRRGADYIITELPMNSNS